MEIRSLEKIAVFIDADNAQANKIEAVIKDISTYGRIVIKRAYANWSKPNLRPWEKEIKRFAIGAIQQFDFASGKNASDMALTIDAMDLLHTGKYDGFVIVSSDSDFTSLAIKLHESGVYVIGYGNKTAVESFRNACDEFNYVEDLGSGSPQLQSLAAETTKTTEVQSLELDNSHKNAAINSAIPDPSDNENVDEAELDNLLAIAMNKYADEDGFVNVASAGSYIKRVHPDFDIKRLGYDKLPEYLRSKKDLYEIEERQGKGTVKLILYTLRK